MERGLLTLSVRRMFLDLPAQLGDIAPPPSTARVIELGDVAQGLVALGVVLLQRELECGDDVARGISSRSRGRGKVNVHPSWYVDAYRYGQDRKGRIFMFEGGIPAEEDGSTANTKATRRTSSRTAR